jgi:hypothetical protein
MKYLLTALLGILVGAAIALAAIYFNPLTRAGGPGPDPGEVVYHYASPVGAGIAFTHGPQSRLPSHPSSIPNLWEAAINQSALSVIVLDAADGTPAAVASRVSYPSEDSELLFGGALLEDDWLISIPGQGSLFVSGRSNWWPFLREAGIPVWYFNQPWAGPIVLTPTVGPGPDGRGLVRGASGQFAGVSGSAAERYQIEEFDNRVGPRQLRGELYWRLDASPPGGG